MTTAPTVTPATTGGPTDRELRRSRIGAAFRMQFILRQNIYVPLIVFAASWALAVGIALWVRSIIGDSPDAVANVYTGASQAAVWTMAFMAAYAASHTFPFALALSYSRRVYMIGTALSFLVLSAGFGVLFTLAAALEQWTEGFGAHSYTFALPFLVSEGLLATGVFATMVTLVAMLIGFGFAMLYKRVSLMQLWLILIGMAAVLAVVVVLIFQADGWPQVWAWMVRQTPWTLSGWLAAVAIVLTPLNYWLIRGATP